MVRYLQWMAAAAACLLGAVSGQSDYPLCGLPPATWTQAANTYPNYKRAFQAMSNVTVGTWYTDNDPSAYTTLLKLLNHCSATTLPVIVVYGLPNKDCHAEESNRGTNSAGGADAYATWIQQLADAVGNRPVIYIMEPDALALALMSPCAKKFGYLDNMAKALPVLSANNNSLVYMDVGYWMMTTQYNQTLVQETLKGFAATSRINGIALDTSNYRTTAEMASMCQDFGVLTDNAYKCVIDTSRNYRGPKAGTGAWCNSKFAALGTPSTNNTANNAIDYFLWLKTPGESDGTCVGQDSDSLSGGGVPGAFFQKAFSLMWDRGYYVDVLKMAKFNEFPDNADAPAGQTGSTSYLALGLVIGGCLILVVLGVLMKRRYDAKQGRRRYADNAVTAPPRTNEAGSRKPYLSL